MTIKLKNRKILFKGANRNCYIHPIDKTKILKVLKPERSPEIKRKSAPIYKKFRPLRSFDDNFKESIAFERLSQKGETIWKHFPKYFGVVKTDLGNALCQEFIKEHDGSVVPSLSNYLKEFGFTNELIHAMENMFSFCWRIELSFVICTRIICWLKGEKVVCIFL